MDFHHFDTSCRSALKNCFRPCPQYTGSPPLNSDYEGSKNDLLSKIWIFFEKMYKVEFFKKSEKNLVNSEIEQNLSSSSIGIWNYHLAPSKLKSRILPCPYASPLCLSTKKSPFTPQRKIFLIDLNSVGFGRRCIIGWVTSDCRAVIRFSKLGLRIVIDCLFLFLSSFLKPQTPPAPPLKTALDRHIAMD